jgi:hypothetical protein
VDRDNLAGLTDSSNRGTTTLVTERQRQKTWSWDRKKCNEMHSISIKPTYLHIRDEGNVIPF